MFNDYKNSKVLFERLMHSKMYFEGKKHGKVQKMKKDLDLTHACHPSGRETKGRRSLSLRPVGTTE